jgi:hypothetical protein
VNVSSLSVIYGTLERNDVDSVDRGIVGVDVPEGEEPVLAPWCSDIISDIMWSVELEPEVEAWIESLSVKEFALVLAHVERLAERGNHLRMPASRAHLATSCSSCGSI